MSEGFSRRNHGNSHSYYLDNQKIPGVTTIIGVLDKPALTQWAATSVATAAVEGWDRFTKMSPIARFEELKTAHRKAKTESAVRGNRIHDLGDRISRGEEVDPQDQDLRSAAQAYIDLLDAWELQPVHTEMPVVSYDYLYAGTADGIFESPKTGRIIVDIKTGKNAYSEVALQLAAYRFATHYLEEIPQTGPRGGKKPSLWEEKPLPDVDGAAVIHIQRETEESPAVARLLPVIADQDIWNVFLYLREVHAQWIERTGYNHRDHPSYNPPIGDQLHPEMGIDQIKEALHS